MDFNDSFDSPLNILIEGYHMDFEPGSKNL